MFGTWELRVNVVSLIIDLASTAMFIKHCLTIASSSVKDRRKQIPAFIRGVSPRNNLLHSFGLNLYASLIELATDSTHHGVSLVRLTSALFIVSLYNMFNDVSQVCSSIIKCMLYNMFNDVSQVCSSIIKCMLYNMFNVMSQVCSSIIKCMFHNTWCAS